MLARVCAFGRACDKFRGNREEGVGVGGRGPERGEEGVRRGERKGGGVKVSLTTIMLLQGEV